MLEENSDELQEEVSKEKRHDEPDEQGRDQVGVGPPVRAEGKDEGAFLDRLEEVEGGGDEEEIAREAQGHPGLAAADVGEAVQEPFEPAVGHAPPLSLPPGARLTRSCPGRAGSPRGSRGPCAAW